MPTAQYRNTLNLGTYAAYVANLSTSPYVPGMYSRPRANAAASNSSKEKTVLMAALRWSQAAVCTASGFKTPKAAAIGAATAMQISARQNRYSSFVENSNFPPASLISPSISRPGPYPAVTGVSAVGSIRSRFGIALSGTLVPYPSCRESRGGSNRFALRFVATVQSAKRPVRRFDANEMRSATFLCLDYVLPTLRTSGALMDPAVFHFCLHTPSCADGSYRAPIGVSH